MRPTLINESLPASCPGDASGTPGMRACGVHQGSACRCAPHLDRARHRALSVAGHAQRQAHPDQVAAQITARVRSLRVSLLSLRRRRPSGEPRLRASLSLAAASVLTVSLLAGCRTRADSARRQNQRSPPMRRWSTQAGTDSSRPSSRRVSRPTRISRCRHGRHEFDGQMPDWSRARARRRYGAAAPAARRAREHSIRPRLTPAQASNAITCTGSSTRSSSG